MEIAESDEPLEEKLEFEEEVPKQEETVVEQANPATEVVRGVKRRASTAFSDGDAEDFKGFDGTEKSDLADFSRIIGKLLLFLIYVYNILACLRLRLHGKKLI